MTITTRSASTSSRANRPLVVSEEIRRAFLDAPPKTVTMSNQTASIIGTGAAPGSADLNAPVTNVPRIDTADDLGDHATPAIIQEVVSGLKPSKATVPSYEDVRARLAQLGIEHTMKLDQLMIELQKLQRGQRDVLTRAVEMESVIGSVVCDMNALGQRVATLENIPQQSTPRPPRSGQPYPSFPPQTQDQFPDPLDSRGARSQGPPHHGTPQLITTATSSAPIPEGAALHPLPADTGPFAPGLEPVQTMLPPFARVVDYRRYRLSDTTAVPTPSELRYLYRLKKQIDGLYPTLGTYDGSKPITLLGFLSTLKEAFEAYATSEAIAVRTLAYFLANEAKDVYQAQVNAGALSGRQALEATWPYVINALIRRFLADETLQNSYDAVVRAEQGPNEDEIKFAQRISDASRECCHVFQPMELVNSYVRGLHEATRERVQEQIKRLPQKERASLVTVRQIAAAEGRAQRALLRHKSPSAGLLRTTPRTTPTRAATRNPMLLLNPNTNTRMPTQMASPPTTPTTPSSYYQSARSEHDEHDHDHVSDAETSIAGDPVSIVEAAVTLEGIFMISTNTKDALEGYNLEGRNIMRPTEEIPDLTLEQVGQAMAVIPTDYWQLSCWSCRSSGHSTFTCPKLTVKQRIYFAYRYYLHQVRSNPILAEWYTQKRNALQGKGPEPGPRPSDRRCDGRAPTRAAQQPYAQGRGPPRRVHLVEEPHVITEENYAHPQRPHFVGPGSTDEENDDG